MGDWLVVTGAPYIARPAYGKPRGRVPGTDIAGTVEAVGNGVTNLKPGDEVFGWCAGALAEYACAPADHFVPKPTNLTLEQAAAVGVSASSALQLLRDQGKIQPGQRVLINGASGGVGTFAVQIAKAFGADVTGVCSTKNVEMVRSIGADHVIDHYAQDISAEVKKLTGKRGVDVVFEHVGAATWSKSLESLAPGGRLVTCGNTTGWDVKLDLRFLFSKQWSLLGSFMGTLGDLHQVLKFVFKKELKPVIDKIYPLREIRAAHERLENKDQFGKVLVVP